MNLSTSAFWDININDLNEEVHADFIIRKVFDHGILQDVKEVLNYFTDQQIIASLTTAPYLDKKTFYFACNYFNISPTDFKCYSKILSARNALNY